MAIDTIQNTLVIGDTLTFNVADDEGLYTPADGWALTFSVRGAGLGADSTGVQLDAETWTVTVAASVTATFTAGKYYYIIKVSKLLEEYTLFTGVITVLADPSSLSTGTTYDGRSRYQVIIDAIDALIAGRASKAQKSYTIGNRQLEFIPYDELLRLRTEYARLENARVRRDSGSFFKTIKTEFRRPQ